MPGQRPWVDVRRKVAGTRHQPGGICHSRGKLEAAMQFLLPLLANAGGREDQSAEGLDVG